MLPQTPSVCMANRNPVLLVIVNVSFKQHDIIHCTLTPKLLSAGDNLSEVKMINDFWELTTAFYYRFTEKYVAFGTILWLVHYTAVIFLTTSSLTTRPSKHFSLPEDNKPPCSGLKDVYIELHWKWEDFQNKLRYGISSLFCFNAPDVQQVCLLAGSLIKGQLHKLN